MAPIKGKETSLHPRAHDGTALNLNGPVTFVVPARLCATFHLPETPASSARGSAGSVPLFATPTRDKKKGKTARHNQEIRSPVSLILRPMMIKISIAVLLLSKTWQKTPQHQLKCLFRTSIWTCQHRSVCAMTLSAITSNINRLTRRKRSLDRPFARNEPSSPR